MRKAILCASLILFAAALVAGCAFAGQTQTPKQTVPLDPKDFEYKSEPGDPAKGELKRNLIIYRPTQQVLLIATDYKDGRTVTQQFRVGINGTIERESEYYPHPTRAGWQYERRRSLYDAHGRLDVTYFYRPDGSVEQQLSPSDPPDITHGTPDIGTTPLIPEPEDTTQPLPKPKPDPDKMPRPKPCPDPGDPLPKPKPDPDKMPEPPGPGSQSSSHRR